jgi:hypothetical protein
LKKPLFLAKTILFPTLVNYWWHRLTQGGRGGGGPKSSKNLTCIFWTAPKLKF